MTNEICVLNNDMQIPQYQVFTHKDLDGAVSLLTFLWSNPKYKISFQEINSKETHVIKDYLDRTINPSNVYVFDLPLRKEFVDQLDFPFITFVDHHKSSAPYSQKFQNAKILYKEYTSNSLLLRKLYAQNSPELTNAQKKLILYADDYNSFKLNYPETYNLNILFWTEYKSNFTKFIKDYQNGFKPFTDNQIKEIKYIKLEGIKEAERLKKFKGTLIIEGKPKSVLGVLSTNTNNVVVDYLLKKEDVDIIFLINTKTEKIYIKQKFSLDSVDLQSFSEKFCDGYGHTFYARGHITPLFMELTKNLNPL